MRVTWAASARATRSIAASTILRRRGLRDFMIQAGGDLYVGGLKGDRPWRLGIQDPRGRPIDSFAALDLSDGTFSTSGDYERFFMKDGRRYHHILDPASGEPAAAAAASRSSPTARSSPTGLPPACSSSVRRRGWRSSSGCPTSKA